MLIQKSLNLFPRKTLDIVRNTAQKMKFSITDFLSKYDQIRRKLRIWSRLLKKSVMENFIFCKVNMKENLRFKQS